MNDGQVGEFLVANAARVADLLTGAGTAGGGGSDTGAARARAERFVFGVNDALEGDLRALQREYELAGERTGGMDDRLDACLYRLADLADAVVRLADPDTALPFFAAMHRGLGDVSRRLSVATLRHLARQAGDASPAGSLSVTMHELRRPLTILSSYAQLLAAGVLGPMPEAANVAIEGISASTEMMVRMVSALAEVSRLEDPTDQLVIEELSCDEVITGAVEQVRLEAQLRDLTINRDVAADAVVSADRRRLVLALTNLVSNAVKHSPVNSTVMVRAWRDHESVHFVVTDHGDGFPPTDAPRLFEKYFRSAAERQREIPGSGLGLYIVKTVADRHGGSVVARVPEDGGAEFELKLPARDRSEG